MTISCNANPLAQEINDEMVRTKDADKLLKIRKPVRIGYFHGGRIYVLYRNYINNEFEKEGVKLELYTRNMYQETWRSLPRIIPPETPKNSQDMLVDLQKTKGIFVQPTGVEVIAAIDNGLLEGGVAGASSFVYAISRGSPVVAVAILGHGSSEKSIRGIVVRNDIAIKSAKDFKGKKIIVPRGGPGDEIFAQEFIEKIGLDPRKDVAIIDGVPLNQVLDYLEEKRADAALLHVAEIKIMEESGKVYLYQGMKDWMDPELAHALLIFRKDFIENHGEEALKIIRAYMKRLKYEESLPQAKKFKNMDNKLRIKYHYKNLTSPVWDYPPLVRMDLLNEIQKLLLKYKKIDGAVDLEKFIDNSFVRRTYEELK